MKTFFSLAIVALFSVSLLAYAGPFRGRGCSGGGCSGGSCSGGGCSSGGCSSGGCSSGSCGSGSCGISSGCATCGQSCATCDASVAEYHWEAVPGHPEQLALVLGDKQVGGFDFECGCYAKYYGNGVWSARGERCPTETPKRPARKRSEGTKLGQTTLTSKADCPADCTCGCSGSGKCSCGN